MVEAVCGEFALPERGADGAVGFAEVGTVAEAAVGGEGGDLFEGGVEVVVVEEAELADAGHVEEQEALCGGDELAVGGGVAALAVGVDQRGAVEGAAGEPVEQRRLAHARGAEEGGGEAGREAVAEGVVPFPGLVGEDECVDPLAAARDEGLDGGAELGVCGDEVGLGEDEERRHGAVVEEGDEALDFAGGVDLDDRLDDEAEVDVGGHDLRLALEAGFAALHDAAAGEEAGDDAGRIVRGLEAHEVADCGLGHEPLRHLLAQPPREACLGAAPRLRDEEADAVGRDDAGHAGERQVALAAELVPAVVPPPAGQFTLLPRLAQGSRSMQMAIIACPVPGW